VNRYNNYCSKQSIDGTEFTNGMVFQSINYTGSVIVHKVEVGQTLDIVSYTYYDNSEYWWVIAMVNSIINPFCIPPGTELIIPVDIRTITRSIETI
jgi:nucleoid-associated protein YgaU